MKKKIPFRVFFFFFPLQSNFESVFEGFLQGLGFGCTKQRRFYCWKPKTTSFWRCIFFKKKKTGTPKRRRFGLGLKSLSSLFFFLDMELLLFSLTPRRSSSPTTFLHLQRPKKQKKKKKKRRRRRGRAYLVKL